MTELVLATQNPGKIAELRDLLAPLGLRVLGLADLGGLPREPEETGDTFLANATIKALAYARATGRLCLADDSGLEVDALGGRPGVISSHFAFEGRTDGEGAAMTREQRDAANNARLLRDLEGVAEEDRTARFVCVMVLAEPGAGGFHLCPGAGGILPPDRAQPDTDQRGRGAGSPPLQDRGERGAGSPPLRAGMDAARFDGSFIKRSGGRLPHWDIADGTYFITFCATKGVVFTEPERQIILNACLHHHEARYWLHTACVMPDHVHLLLRTIQRPDGSWPTGAEVVHSLKSFTSNQINPARGRTGPLWQREYFDRLVRSGPEMDEANRYIQRNAQRAGLCGKAMDYPFVWRQERNIKQPGAEGFQPSDRARPDAEHPSSALRADGGLEAPRSAGAKVLATSSGAFEGRIGLPGDVPRGPGGFGYDPLFLVGPDFTRTGAELDKAEKNRLSHRGAAVRAMIDQIGRMSALIPDP